MGVTIATHNGSAVDLAHDLREKWRIEEENRKWAEKHPGELRIDLSKEHEVLVNRGTLSQVYHELFDEAVEKYNQKKIASGHPEQQVKNYLSEIKASEGTRKSAKHPIYEIITSIGSVDNPVDEKLAKEILTEHARGFQERNPNLIVVTQVYHGDEAGVAHVHTSYIPVAYNMTRGMETQNSLNAALLQQGIKSEKYYNTAQMMWEKKENEALEEICKKHGLEVIHPQAGTKQEHLSVEEYKTKKQLENAQEELEKVQNLPLGTVMVKKGRLEQLEEIEKKYNTEKSQIDQIQRDKQSAVNTMEAYLKAYTNLQKEMQDFDSTVNEAANKKISLLKDKVMEFIKRFGLMEKFENWQKEEIISVKGIKR